MENTPEAAAPATEATNTNTNQAEAPAEQAKAEAPKEPDTQGFTAEQLTEMKKFMDANGGYDKAFKTFKERISNPAPEAPKEEPKVPAQPQQNQEAAPSRIPDGYMSRNEDALTSHYARLAARPEYAPIADKLRNGEAITEMRKFGIEPMDKDGNINIGTAYKFLDLLAKTVPAQPAQTPESAAAPTVDYIPTNGGKIESYEQAARIIAQSEQLRGQNQAEHPDLAAAKEFIKNALTGGKKK